MIANDEHRARLQRIGFVTAMPAEAATLGRRARSVAEWPRVACGGIGSAAATAAANTLVAQGAELLVSWGVAGGLEAELQAGNLILYTSVIDAATETEYRCDPRWIEQTMTRLNHLNVRQRIGLSVSAPVTMPHEKAGLNRRYRCAAVDMESAAIAAVARTHGLGFAGLRVISDPATTSLTATALVALGPSNHSAWRVVVASGRRPWELLALLRLGLQYGSALKHLKRAAAALPCEYSHPSLTKSA
ncbi:MAG: hypothetical protein HYX63_14695 [Gammaproteobacteria bacterium]|nr:hypothetical protein [Gammaproteobacteria bacterium]